MKDLMKVPKMLFLVLFFCIGNAGVQASNVVPDSYSCIVAHLATINTNTGLISINANAPVQNTYTFDVSGLQFATQVQASQYFNRYTKNAYIGITVNMQTKVATMVLDYTLIADMQLSVAKWNKLLQMANEQ